MKRRGRALLGYYPRDEAVAALRGGLVVPGDGAAEADEIWNRLHSAVESRPLTRFDAPVVEAPSEARATIDAITARADLQALFAPHRWRIGFVDLSKPVLTYQRAVLTEDAVERVMRADPDDLQTLFQICLPEPEAVEMEGGFDASQNAFTTSSANPNLRIGGFAAVDIRQEPAGAPNKLFGFTVSLGSSVLQLVEYKRRWFVRDGYHRVYGLLKRGITRVPCVLIEAKSFEETGAARPGFFSFELLYSERPPLVSDFLTDEFSAEIPLAAVRKVIRIKAEEFVIPS